MQDLKQRIEELRQQLQALAGSGAPASQLESVDELLAEMEEHCGAMQEQLQREIRFVNRVVDTAHAIILVLDADGRIVRFNRFMEELSGYRLEEVEGKEWFSTFLPDRDIDEIRALFQKALNDGEVRGHVNAIVTKDGCEREIEWYAKSLHEADGVNAGVLAVGQDISEQRRLEAEYRQAQKMEAVGTLSSGVAHDFNNLLMGIIGCASIALSRLEQDHAARRFISEILDAARGGASVTQRLLNFTSKRPLSPKPICVDDLLQGVVTLLTGLVGDDVRIDFVPGAEGGLVVADEGQLDHIVMNLATNARDAMPEGGTLAISTIVAPNKSKPGRQILLTVKDSGVGMPPEVLERIFEPFFTTKDAGQGTGLGLSTVYGIVKQIGGQIETESKLGRGTTFRIYLPLADSAEQADVAVAPAEVVEQEAPAKGTILVAEDSSAARSAICAYLEDQGYNVLEAATGSLALKLGSARLGEIDVLLSDVSLPGVGGVELVRRLRAESPELKVIYMTGHAPEEVPRNAGELLLHKPFDFDDLTQKLREVASYSSG